MNKQPQQNNQEKPIKEDKAQYRAVDHLVIKDRKSGKTIVNIRG